jgi:carbamoyl-phosphate synthase large subunit
VIRGDDYDETLRIASSYKVSALLTAATDKPLIMMARIAQELCLPFYSVETARKSVDKLFQKECFVQGCVPCARGRLLSRTQAQEGSDGNFVFPVIVKPRDNSGSRGVVYCGDQAKLQGAIGEAFSHTKLDTILVEEYVDGKEYSIEALHFAEKSVVIQFTEKITTPLPYNVELGHVQPAMLTAAQREEIEAIIHRVAQCLGFTNCASHTELKIRSRGVCVIETSPRLGGDQITSTLTPLSTGICIEQALIEIALGQTPQLSRLTKDGFSMIRYFNLQPGTRVRNSHRIRELCRHAGVVSLTFELEDDEMVPVIRNSLDRYGEVVFLAQSRESLTEEYAGFCSALEALL